MTGDPIVATTAAIGATTAATTEACAGRTGHTPESRDTRGRRPVLAVGFARGARTRGSASRRLISPLKLVEIGALAEDDTAAAKLVLAASSRL